jgi:triosephosphate isomerase
MKSLPCKFISAIQDIHAALADGALVGGASLNADHFLAIVRAAVPQ